MCAISEEIDTVARSGAKVLITGENGVGKEVVAGSSMSAARARGRSSTINCAGLPEWLLESELFGHVRGSFTGAHRDRRGWLDRAENGTIFLDEVGEMSLRMQALLLRYVESGEIQRVGSDRLHTSSNVRIIAATNRNLEERVAEKAISRRSLLSPECGPHRDPAAPAASGGHRPAPRAFPADAQRRPWHRAAGARGSSAQRAHFLFVARQRPRAEQRRRAAHPSQPIESHRPCGSHRRDGDIGVRANTGAGVGDTALAERRGAVRPDGAGWRVVLDVVYSRFTSHDLTRDDLRALVARGIAQTGGDYRELAALFNVSPHEYRRFRTFLTRQGAGRRIRDDKPRALS